MILGILLQMLRELGDPGAENRDLHLRGAGVGLMGAVAVDDDGLLLFGDHSKYILSENRYPVAQKRAERPPEQSGIPRIRVHGRNP